MVKVLIVDDEPDVLLILRLALEGAGYATSLAADGDVALELLQHDRFDAVVLDLMMPVLDGWGVLEALGDRTDAPPAIVLSAKSAASDIARATQLGAADYITKPFELEDLVGRIRAQTIGSERSVN